MRHVTNSNNSSSKEKNPFVELALKLKVARMFKSKWHFVEKWTHTKEVKAQGWYCIIMLSVMKQANDSDRHLSMSQ